MLVSLAVAGSLAAASSRVTAPLATAAASVTYSDSTGEAGAAPDIATVVVSNDDAGLVTFAVTFTNRTSLGPTEWVFVDLDADRDPTTGTPGKGFDYGIEIGAVGGSSLWKYDPAAADWKIAPMNSLTSVWAGSTLNIRISTADLGATKGFRFGVLADPNPDDEAAPVDLAPDSGRDLWVYEVSVYVAPVVKITTLDCKPEPAVAGRTMTGKATVVVTRGGVAEKLAAGTKVVWKATIGSLKLKPRSTTVGAGGVLRSTWKLPTTKAKAVRVSVTVTMEKTTVTKTHVHRIR